MPSPRRVLFVSYLFPPVGGVGVHRVTKFVKYLPEFGWESSVLTVSNPSVPLLDDSLNKDIPAGTIIRRAKTYEPGYALKKAVSGSQQSSQGNWILKQAKGLARKAGNTLLQPDSQVLWHHHAYRAGLKLLREIPHDVIIATGPPFSSLILGAKLARKTGVPLILDYRDEWDISNAYWENKGQGKFANWMQNRQQAKALQAANRILATTPSSAAAIGTTAINAGSQAHATYIYNGFDPDDYPTSGTLTKKDYGNGTHRFRLSFIGTLWNLNSIEPVVRAIELLSVTHPQLLEECEVLLAGRRMEDQDAIVDRLNGLSVAVTRLPFVEHREAIELMRTSDALLMLNSDLPKTKRIVNAKTFEYMAAERPIFVVAPEGDVWDLVRHLPGTRLCEPRNINVIASELALAIEEQRCGINYQDAHWDIQKYHRKALAEQLANLLNETRNTDESPLYSENSIPNH